MTRLTLITVVLLGVAAVALPAAARPYQRSGTTAGGPGTSGRPGELAPGAQAHNLHHKARPHGRRPGQLALGEVPRGINRAAGPHGRRPGEIHR